MCGTHIEMHLTAQHFIDLAKQHASARDAITNTMQDTIKVHSGLSQPYQTGSYFSSIGYYNSWSTVETYCFAEGLCLFKQPWSVIFNYKK